MPSAGQGVSCMLWNPNSYYQVHECQLQDLIVRHMQPPSTIKIYSRKILLLLLFCHLKGSIFELFYSLWIIWMKSTTSYISLTVQCALPTWFHHRNVAYRGVTFLFADDSYPLLDPDILISTLVVKHDQGWEIWPKFPTHTKPVVDKTIVQNIIVTFLCRGISFYSELNWCKNFRIEASDFYISQFYYDVYSL